MNNTHINYSHNHFYFFYLFLQSRLSEKILEYHQSGFIEDLIEVHFADAQCYQQRMTQEESQLEVQHHAGLFVLLTVGILLGIIVLLLEHAAFKVFVPYFRATPGNSCWRSSHVMFLSQVRKHTSFLLLFLVFMLNLSFV